MSGLEIRRRHALAALAGFVAAPAIPAVAAPSDLVTACNNAVVHMARINDHSDPARNWPDDRLDDEIEAFNAVVRRMADTPARGLAEVQAKARLIIADYGSDIAHPGAPSHERLLYGLLNEVLAL